MKLTFLLNGQQQYRYELPNSAGKSANVKPIAFSLPYSHLVHILGVPYMAGVQSSQMVPRLLQRETNLFAQNCCSLQYLSRISSKLLNQNHD